MDRGLPEDSVVRSAIALAMRAPSVRNSQPWRFVVDDRRLHLYAGRDRQVRDTNPADCGLLLSCGAALHHLRIAFSALGWRTRVKRLPNPAEPEHLASLEPRRHEPRQDEIALAAAIPRRRTDRRRYSSWPVPPTNVTLLAERAGNSDIALHAVSDPVARALLAGSIAEADRVQRISPAHHAEWPQWAGELVPRAPDEEREPVLLVLGTAADDRMSRLRAGEATSELVLTATSLGLASCPLIEPLEIGDSREVLRARVMRGGHVQVVLRLGWAAVNADPLPATPRRALDEVLHYAASLPARS